METNEIDTTLEKLKNGALMTFSLSSSILKLSLSQRVSDLSYVEREMKLDNDILFLE